MPATLPPGIGNPEQASQATAFIRQQPWYQELVQSWGIDPNDVDANGNLRQKLSDTQEQQVLKAAQDNGVGISENSYHIDENGQIAKNDSHWLRNALIGAGIGAAALTGFGAAGIGPLSGLFGGAEAATAASPFAAGLGGADVAGAGALGGGGVLAGLPGAAMSLPALGGEAATVGTVAGDITDASQLAGGGGSSLSKIGGLLGAAGKGIGDATTAAGNNALNQEQLGLRAADTDITGQQAYTDEQIAVNKENAAMENQHLKDQYMLEKAQHPSVSPFDITGDQYSPEYTSSLQTIAAQNPELLKMPTPYKPIGANGLQAATGTTPSTLQTIGNILSPALTVAPKIAAMF